MPLAAAHPLALQQLPESPGLFRIRRERGADVFYFGAARAGLRRELERLARQIQLPRRPATTDALAVQLWESRQASGVGFQVSGVRCALGEIDRILTVLRDELDSLDDLRES
jgi:hypothetical protein